jgi:hypothetical protein
MLVSSLSCGLASLKKQSLSLTSSRFFIGDPSGKAAQGIDPWVFVTLDDQGHGNLYRGLLSGDIKVNLADLESGFLAHPVNGTSWHWYLPRNQLNLNPHHSHEQLAGLRRTFVVSSLLSFSPTWKNGRYSDTLGCFCRSRNLPSSRRLFEPSANLHRMYPGACQLIGCLRWMWMVFLQTGAVETIRLMLRL